MAQADGTAAPRATAAGAALQPPPAAPSATLSRSATLFAALHSHTFSVAAATAPSSSPRRPVGQAR